MATDLKKPSPSLPRHELFVEQQIERVSKRLHALDLGRIALVLGAIVVGHALVMALIDLASGPRPGTFVTAVRLGIWGLSLAGVLCLGGLLALRVFRRINPYYAARQIEDTIPDAKNSVVNWLDLREKQLPAAVKNALGLRAAQDLKATDPEQSIPVKRSSWILAMLAAGLLLGLVLVLLSEPGRFASLMQRAFLPLGDSILASRTRIILLQPANGDLAVLPQQKINFQVRIAGPTLRMNMPQSPRLQYRYQKEENWVTLPLEKDRDEETWIASMLSDQVQNGFSYKVLAGDTETPEYQVTVRSLPEAKRFELTYRYPAYLRPYFDSSERTVVFPNEDAVDPRIKAPRGTEVSLVVRTNRDLLGGKVELEVGNDVKDVQGDVLADDVKSFRVKFILEKSGQFRIGFTTKAGDVNSDNAAHDIHVIPDNAPVVELKKPGQDVQLPANGTLKLEGFASDDFGIRQLVLRMEVVQGPIKSSVAPKAFRPEKLVQFKDGTFPDRIPYSDFVVLNQLKSLVGEFVRLESGDVLAYWLEATDICDYPEGRPNMGRSKIYRVTIGEPLEEKKQREEVRQAEKEQKANDKRLDDELKQQEQDRRLRQEQKQQRQPNQANNQDRSAEEQKLQDDVLKRIEEQQRKEKAQNGSAENGQKSELTEKDVDKLKNNLKEPGPLKDLAEKELDNAARRAKDEKVRQAAEDALKNQPPAPGQEPSRKDIDRLKEILKQKGPLAEAAARELAKAAQQAKDKESRQAAQDALKDRPERKTEWTEKDVAELKDLLKQLGPVGDMANRELDKAAKQAKDEKVRQAADEALKNRQPPQPTAKEVDDLTKMLKDKGRLGDAAAEELADLARNAKDPQIQKAAQEAIKDRPPSAEKKELTEKDIAQLKKMMGEEGASNRAARELADAAKNAKDEKVRQAAEEALKSAPKPNREPTAKDIERLKEKLGDKGRVGDAAAQELAKMSEQARDPKTRQAAEEALKSDPSRRHQTDISKKDVADLKKMLQEKGALKEFAQRELKDAAQNSKNADTRQAAGEALKDQPAQSGQEASVTDVERLKEMARDGGRLGNTAKGELSKIARDAKDPATRQAAQDALKSMPQAGNQQAHRHQTDISPRDIAKLKDLLNEKGPAGDLARRELARAAEAARDPAARQAAGEALKNQPPGKLAEATPKDIEPLKKLLKEKGPLAQASADELAKLAKDAKNTDTRKAAADAIKQAQADRHQTDITPEEVAHFQKMMKREGLLGDQAARELADAARNARDPEARKAAQEALKNRAGQKTEDVTPDDVDLLKEMLKEKGELGGAAGRELQRLAKQAKNANVRKAAEAALKEAGIDPQAKHDPVRNASKDMVAQLKEMQKRDGLLGDLAQQKLAELARLAKDPEVRKAAEEALKNRPQKKDNPSPEDIAALKKLLEDPGALGDSAAQELDRLAQQSQDPGLGKAARQALADSKRDPVTLQRKSDPIKAEPPDLASAFRSGNLSLEDLKKFITPDFRKKAGISEEKWQQFDKNQQDARADGKDDSNRRGDPSLLPSTAPRLVDPAANANSSSAQSGRGEPPAAFRDVYIRWTTRRQNADRK